MKILFKFATKSRPLLFERGIQSIIDNCTNSNYVILVSIDSDDEETKAHVKDKYYKNTFIKEGTSISKIDAINRDVELIKDWDILVNMSDDMVFTKRGFDNIIRSAMSEAIDGRSWSDKCLHFPDGNRNDLITMSVLGREFYDRFGYIYHPDYISLYCDNEQTEVAKALGCYKYVDEQITHHLHPAYGKAHFDLQYQHTESFSNIDKETFLLREQTNFDL